MQIKTIIGDFGDSLYSVHDYCTIIYYTEGLYYLWDLDFLLLMAYLLSRGEKGLGFGSKCKSKRAPLFFQHCQKKIYRRPEGPEERVY